MQTHDSAIRSLIFCQAFALIIIYCGIAVTFSPGMRENRAVIGSFWVALGVGLSAFIWSVNLTS